MKAIMVTLACWLLMGCVSTGEPDTAADIGRGVGRGFEVLAQTVPGVSGAMSTVDEFRVHRQELRKRAEDRAVRERMWKQCVENPCLYADDCAELFPESFMVPNCAGKTRAGGGGAAAPAVGAPERQGHHAPLSGLAAPLVQNAATNTDTRGGGPAPLARLGGTEGVNAAATRTPEAENSVARTPTRYTRSGGTGGVEAAANSDDSGRDRSVKPLPADPVRVRGVRPTLEGRLDWKARTRTWEGTCHATIVDRHIGCGHSCTANKDCEKYANAYLTPSAIDDLFDADWAEAERRSMEHLGVTAGPVVSACFRYGCAPFDSLEELWAHLISIPDARNIETAAAIYLLMTP